MQSIAQIETIFVLMFENRSFDHLMGYLGLAPYSRDLEGLQKIPNYTNEYNGFQYTPFPLGNPGQKLPDDPPHERENIATQIDPDPATDPCSMRGFVRSYAQIREIDPADKPMVLGYYLAGDVPATHFFATNYGICDHWFAAIPTGTQPNRLMAMSGQTLNDRNQSLILPKQDLVYDWLDRNKITWRVYHQGIPFFMMMDDWHLKVLTDDHFRDYGSLQDDLNSTDPFPQVVFIEPRYTDAPHVEAACDDHAPSPITPGQEFLKRVYSDLLTNQNRWQKSLLIVNYDENGGFFDHVKPLPIVTNPPTGATYTYGPFSTTGPRVPAYLISPFVKPGAIYKGNLDHTSVLKCIAKRFGNGSYSPQVDARPVGNIWDALELDAPRTDAGFPPPPSDAGFTPLSTPEDEIPQDFAAAAAAAKTNAPADAQAKFPELFSHFGNI
jgi:phospholipase C